MNLTSLPRGYVLNGSLKCPLYWTHHFMHTTIQYVFPLSLKRAYYCLYKYVTALKQ